MLPIWLKDYLQEKTVMYLAFGRHIIINCSQFAFGAPANFLVGVRAALWIWNEPFKISHHEASGDLFCQINKIDEFQ